MHNRNFDKVQHEHLRKKIDAKFNRVHDKLETAYYQFWKKGLSKKFVAKRGSDRKPILVFDIRPNNPDLMGKAVWNKTTQEWDTSGVPLSPKELFDKLHGMLWHIYQVRFHERNQLEPAKDRVPENKYNELFDNQGNKIGDKHTQSQGFVNQLKTEGLDLDGEEEATDQDER